jgi:hypothetical protein
MFLYPITEESIWGEKDYLVGIDTEDTEWFDPGLQALGREFLLQKSKARLPNSGWPVQHRGTPSLSAMSGFSSSNGC